ncbi:MAG: serine hydrolase [Deltaproteobacteria bacterium]|nr:serine hydrolase [Deltaproteobacteria bacterium]
MGEDAKHYGIVVLDLSEPAKPRYADVNGAKVQNPASVGKIAVALAIFQALADVYPNDIAAREKLLRDTVVTANRWSQTDHHKVPIWKPGDPSVKWRPIEEGDQENLWTYLDWMASASSNGAASQLMSELMLLRHFGKEYPVSTERAQAYFNDTPKSALSKAYLSAMLEPLKRNGLNTEKLRQGGFFTRSGKVRIPGTNSVATAGELVHFMMLMEEGKLVDPWSSLEIKRLLYLTDTRIRYAASPALNSSALYFKSGSLYSCKDEAGFTCGKYIGNRLNYMNSIAIVEVEENGRSLHYMVAILSNVLKKNSSNIHVGFAKSLHELIESYHAPVEVPAEAPSAAGAAGAP